MTSKVIEKPKSSVLPSAIVAAHDKWGLDFFKINPESRSNKDGKVKYYKNLVVLADGKEVSCFLKIPVCKINGCKSPEERAKVANGLGPGFSINRSTVSDTGEPVGMAMYLIGKAWEYQANKLQISTRQMKGVNPIVQEFAKDKDGNPTIKLDDPINRVKIRAANKDTTELARPIKVMYAKNGRVVPSNRTPDDEPITTMTVHKVVKGNSQMLGVIDYSTTNYSQQGWANQASSEIMTIVPGRSHGLSEEDELDPEELAALKAHVRIDREEPEIDEPGESTDDAPVGHSIEADPKELEKLKLDDLEMIANDL